MKDFYKQGVRRGGLIIGGVPEHSEHGRVYAGKTADVLSDNCNFNNTSEFHSAASAVSALFLMQNGKQTRMTVYWQQG